MKTIVKKWDKSGGKGIFVLDQPLYRILQGIGIDHIGWTNE